ncbi:General secretion pathway protein E (Type II traffic warden ATPase) [Bradyrhizobium sp. ORS 375]|uniref:GspE/PulE family protein n=1 Tax=Bradyrhizobium sp. (strain ORS 375) TaxID=566679 RepID=UPI0002407A71|nr:GspE/PulE family protein [Bradyrhizobium sp. ORS 375]CCD93740.1 General secretion pathway protein E (Type II traffic warden ATPase) [Bradyrhizobium sp. ORS 375]
MSDHAMMAHRTPAAIAGALSAMGGLDRAELLHGFGDFLLAESILDRMSLDRARRASLTTGDRLDMVLTKLGLVSEVGLVTALSKYLALDLVRMNEVPIEPVLPELVEAAFVRHNRVLPLGRRDGRLSVGVTDPFNHDPVRALAFLTGLAVDMRLFTAADFDKACGALYPINASHDDSRLSGGAEANEADVQRLRDLASEAPIIRLVNQVIANAVEARASDIHIEPNVDQVLVRYRIDGVLRTVQALAADLRAAITSRVKIMSKLDIAERRLPQDGRIKIAVRGIDIDFRVSTIPTAFGESVVLRVLDRNRVSLDFAELGFSEEHIATLRSLLQQPNGIILVTGPTGSGKTTTLYTALKALNNAERKIFTVEDPIEYQMPGINQVQVQSDIGLTFPHALRAMLRQDPDIIMIGEIRDLETARIAIQASLTGHLVLSTLHTNNAASAITRLIDIGVENYLLASTLKGVIAQRLVRKLCTACAGRHPQASFWAESFERSAPGLRSRGAADIRQPQGCADCGHTGFAGRSTIAEMLVVDDDGQRLILAKAADTAIERAARERGMQSMYDVGVRKVWQGETTIDEVLRATRMG